MTWGMIREVADASCPTRSAAPDARAIIGAGTVRWLSPRIGRAPSAQARPRGVGGRGPVSLAETPARAFRDGSSVGREEEIAVLPRQQGMAQLALQFLDRSPQHR